MFDSGPTLCSRHTETGRNAIQRIELDLHSNILGEKIRASVSRSRCRRSPFCQVIPIRFQPVNKLET